MNARQAMADLRTRLRRRGISTARDLLEAMLRYARTHPRQKALGLRLLRLVPPVESRMIRFARARSLNRRRALSLEPDPQSLIAWQKLLGVPPGDQR